MLCTGSAVQLRQPGEHQRRIPLAQRIRRPTHRRRGLRGRARDPRRVLQQRVPPVEARAVHGHALVMRRAVPPGHRAADVDPIRGPRLRRPGLAGAVARQPVLVVVPAPHVGHRLHHLRHVREAGPPEVEPGPPPRPEGVRNDVDALVAPEELHHPPPLPGHHVEQMPRGHEPVGHPFVVEVQDKALPQVGALPEVPHLPDPVVLGRVLRVIDGDAGGRDAGRHDGEGLADLVLHVPDDLDVHPRPGLHEPRLAEPHQVVVDDGHEVVLRVEPGKVHNLHREPFGGLWALLPPCVSRAVLHYGVAIGQGTEHGPKPEAKPPFRAQHWSDIRTSLSRAKGNGH